MVAKQLISESSSVKMEKNHIMLMTLLTYNLLSLTSPHLYLQPNLPSTF